MKTYSINCPICKKTTEHFAFRFNLKKGVRIQCIICNHKKQNYYNLNKLKEKTSDDI